MKKSISKSMMMAIALMAISSIGYSQVATETSKSTAATELKYIGNLEGFPVFELDLNNQEAGEYDVTITDNHNEVLYTATLKGTGLSKKYRLDLDEEDLKNVRFAISSKKTNENLVYEVSKKIGYVQDVSVARL
jgi:outer membrane lipoprotein-sorting protein